ncbi:MAG: DUF3267 domain-containing protein [Clostridia bacterium]|nr:DUF3267 domain-containing protein [Clostridia bacterium]
MEEKTNNYKHELPENYEQVYHIDAKDFKIGLILNLGALIIMGISGVLVAITTILSVTFNQTSIDEFAKDWYLFIVIFIPGIIVYMILHELVHGIAYKSLTKEKLSFGISWSCAYCGVPNIYVYRKASMISLIMPCLVFSILFITLGAIFFFVNPILHVAIGALFSMHIGGCVGDLYMFFLYIFKFKDKETLMKDTGPEQFIYQKIQ